MGIRPRRQRRLPPRRSGGGWRRRKIIGARGKGGWRGWYFVVLRGRTKGLMGSGCRMSTPAILAIGMAKCIGETC